MVQWGWHKMIKATLQSLKLSFHSESKVTLIYLVPLMKAKNGIIGVCIIKY